MKAKFYLILSLILFAIAIGLFLWLIIGQYIAQLNYDGQYISWRTIKDISLWGYMGFLPLTLSGISYFLFLGKD